MALSAYGTELPFRQSVIKIPSERTAQVGLVDINKFLLAMIYQKNHNILYSLYLIHIVRELKIHAYQMFIL
jgi:hypothetical protein